MQQLDTQDLLVMLYSPPIVINPLMWLEQVTKAALGSRCFEQGSALELFGRVENLYERRQQHARDDSCGGGCYKCYPIRPFYTPVVEAGVSYLERCLHY